MEGEDVYTNSSPEVREFLRSELKRELRKAHRSGDVERINHLRSIKKDWNAEDGVVG